MVDDADTQAEIADLARRRPELVAFARLASVAAIVEPPLLRRLRLEVGGTACASLGSSGDIPKWHAGLESDLYFSRLTQTATANQMTLRPAVLELLRAGLTDPRHQETARMARHVVVDAHREHSDMVRLEEDIIWSTIIGDIDAVESALDRALVTLRGDARRSADVLRWFTQARRRLPTSALRGFNGTRLLTAVGMSLDRVIPPELLSASRFPEVVADLAPTSLPQNDVGVVLTADSIRFTVPDHARAGLITIPDTRPKVVEATWQDREGRSQSALVRAGEGDTARLPGLSGAAVLRTIAGTRFGIRSAQIRQIVVALYGSIRALASVENLARDLTMAVSNPDIGIRVVRNPPSIFAKPEVFLLGTEPDQQALEQSLEQLGRAVTRSSARSAPAVLLVAGTVTPRQQSLVEILRNRVAVSSVAEPNLIAELTSAVRKVAAAAPLYQLDLDSAITMLGSVALTFHVREFWRLDDGTEADVHRAFDLPPGDDSKAYRTFEQVRGECEYVFSGPVRDYLAGGSGTRMNPRRYSLEDTGDVESIFDENELTQFDTYLEWLVSQWVRFAEVLRNRLGPAKIATRFPVPPDVLEAVRIAVGVRALPLGRDEHATAFSSSSGPELYYVVERAELPTLINALSEVVLTAVREEGRRRETSETDAGKGADVLVKGIPTLDGTVQWAVGGGAVTRSSSFRSDDPDTFRYNDFGREARRLLGGGRMSPVSASDAGELGQRVRDALPERLWSEVEDATVRVTETRRRPQTELHVQVVSAIDIPWEVAITRTPNDPRRPPYLGAQVQLATWPLPFKSVGRRRGRLTVGDIAVLGANDAVPDPNERGYAEEVAILTGYGARRISPTSSALRRELEQNPEVGILHIPGDLTGHGEVLGSGLVLDDGQFVQPDTIRRLNIDGTLMVFISTANELNHDVAAALLEAGAAAVVALMWNVRGREAVQIVRQFYRGVLDLGTPVAEQLRLLRAENHPLGTSALAYRFFGDVSLSLDWRPQR